MNKLAYLIKGAIAHGWEVERMEVIYAHPWWTSIWIVIIFGFLSGIGKKK